MDPDADSDTKKHKAYRVWAQSRGQNQESSPLRANKSKRVEEKIQRAGEGPGNSKAKLQTHKETS